MLTQTDQGGLATQISPLQTLNRYLILGIQDSFYQTEAEALQNFVLLVGNAMTSDPEGFVRTVLEARVKAPKPNACIVALAIACCHENQAVAWPLLDRVVRNGSHMMLFVRIMTDIRGWGSRPRRLIGKWYQDRENLGYDLLKYQGRTWYDKRMTQKRILECVHKRYFQNDVIYDYVVGGKKLLGGTPDENYINYVSSMGTRDESEILSIISSQYVSWEMVPSEKRTAAVWEALLPNMGSTALLRNMGVMAAGGVSPRMIAERVQTVREHPINILIAWYMYRQGHGNLSQLMWTPQREVLIALESAFYRSFDYVEPTGQKLMIALDVSSSMTYTSINGIAGLNARTFAAVMAMVTARREADPVVVAFATNLIDFPLTASMGLEDVIDKMKLTKFGSTNSSLVVKKMIDEKLDIDALLVYSDMQSSDYNTPKLLQQYRESREAFRYVEIAMVANSYGFSYNEDDARFVGFSADLPQSISAFLTV